MGYVVCPFKVLHSQQGTIADPTAVRWTFMTDWGQTHAGALLRGGDRMRSSASAPSVRAVTPS